MVNFSQDSRILNLIVFSDTKISIFYVGFYLKIMKKIDEL